MTTGDGRRRTKRAERTGWAADGAGKTRTRAKTWREGTAPAMQKGLPFLEALFTYRLARLAGFEPTTPWFVAKYSIQLSYSRTRGPNCIAICISRKRFLKGLFRHV